MGRKGVKNMRVKKICMIGAAAVLLAVGIGLYIGQNRLANKGLFEYVCL